MLKFVNGLRCTRGSATAAEFGASRPLPTLLRQKVAAKANLQFVLGEKGLADRVMKLI